MSHMSGLPRNLPCPGIFVNGCNLTTADILDNIGLLRLLFPPGSDAAYSNLGFSVLGQAMAFTQGMAWNDSIQKLVFEPLDMKNSGNSYGPGTQGMAWNDSIQKLVFEPLNMKNSGNSYGPGDLSKMAVGYYPDGRKAEWLDVGWSSPAGQSYSSTADLAKLMSLVFSMNKSMGQEISQVHHSNNSNNLDSNCSDNTHDLLLVVAV